MQLQRSLRAGGGRRHDRSERRRFVAARAIDKFVAPWGKSYDALRDAGLQTVAPEAAAKLVAAGTHVLIDVRRPDQHEVAHPSGAVSVPMYRLIDTSGSLDIKKVARVVAFAFNGVAPIEPCLDFVPAALAAAGGRKIIVACEAGGTMKPTPSFPQGKPSRSLQAAHKLITEAGSGLSAGDVLHLERGIYGWHQADLPMTGDYTPDLGRTPMAAADPTLQNTTQSAGYEMKEGDSKPLEPAAASKKGWFGF